MLTSSKVNSLFESLLLERTCDSALVFVDALGAKAERFGNELRREAVEREPLTRSNGLLGRVMSRLRGRRSFDESQNFFEDIFVKQIVDEAI